MSLSWVACSAVDGRLIVDLPDLDIATVSVFIGAYTTTQGTLPIPTAPDEWELATLHGGAFLVLLDDPGDGTSPVPVWGGLVLRRERTLGDEADLSVASIEAYLDRRFVGDRDFTNTSQTQIVRLLVEETATRFPIRVQASTSTTLRTRSGDDGYKDAADKTLLSVLSELSGVIGGPEWTVGWESGTTAGGVRTYTPVLYVADRIGSSPVAGMGPSVTFEAPGPVVDVRFVEDFGSSKGATKVMAVSTASADARPQSPWQSSSDVLRPPFEHRFTPSTSISQVSTLTEHAQAALVRMADGAQSLTLTAVMQDAPRLGRDWFIGDDVGYQITAPAFPRGLVGTARCLGWSIDLTEPAKISPILATEES